MSEELRRVVAVGDDLVGRPALGGAAPGGIFGGQLVALTLSAAGHAAPAGSVPDSITANLLGGSRADEPVRFRVDVVRAGRSLQVLSVRGAQATGEVVHATVVATVPSGDADWQSASAPDVAPPDAASAPLLRVLDAGVFDVATPAGREAMHPVWLRSRATAGDDPWLAGAAVAYWSDFGMNFAARARHESVQGPAHGVSATHSLTIHRGTAVTDWHLFDVDVRTVSGNQGFAVGSLFHASGVLVATATQRAHLRPQP